MASKKNTDHSITRSSAAEYLTFVAASGGSELSIEMRYQDENIWLTQKMMAALYDVSVAAINQHLKRVFSDGELAEALVIKDYLITAADGKNYQTKHYNLQAIIAVGFKVNNPRAVQFRKWAGQIVKDYTIQGWTMDVERLKKGHLFTDEFFNRQLELIREIRLSERRFYQKVTDLYATAFDYDHVARLVGSFALLAGGLPAAELLVPSQYTTIQSAVDAAGDGDIITISPGTYVENIKVKGSNLTFRSIDPDNLDVRNSTLVNGAVPTSVFDFTNFSLSGEFRIQGLYIKGEDLAYGGAIRGVHDILILVDNCKFLAGASFEGGAIYNTKGMISNSLFERCGVLTGASSGAQFTLGGAISRFDGLVENCDFIGNFSDGISNNNQGNTTRSAGSGGAIGNSSGIIRNSRFSRNRATNRGGAISGFQGLIEDCFFEQNSATNFGGALNVIEEGSIINRCVFVKNSAFSVGAINSSEADILNSMFIYNKANSGTGGVSLNTFGTYSNCIFFGNNAKIGASTFLGSYGTIRNCIIWNNTSGDNSLFGEILINLPEYSVIQGWEPDDRGNINAPPSFIDPTLDANNHPRDFRLRPDSPAIDRGLRVFDSGTSVSQALQLDADGNPRPVVNYPTDIFNRGDGFGTDIGAYEHQTVYEELPRTELWLLR